MTALPHLHEENKDYTFSLLYELYDNEVQYTQDLYDGVGLTEELRFK